MTNRVNIQSLMLSGDVIQSTLTLKIVTTTQVIKMLITVNSSPIQGYAHPDGHKYYIPPTCSYELRWNPSGNWVILIFGGQNPCPRII